MKIRLFFIVLSILLPFHLEAQYYDMGQDPGNLKWMQVETERFKVVYPQVFEKEAVKYLNEVERAYSILKDSYPELNIKIPIVIHNYSSISNGTVVWAPKRMEIFPTPEQDGMPIDNFRQLAIHELSHVFQMTSLEKSFTKLGRIVFGEQFTGLASATLPSWYLEGQAVFNETYYTESGRGRTAAFMKQLKAISVEKGMYKYDKLLLQSFKDYVPNHYYTGYQIVSSLTRDYGVDIWNEMLDYTAKYPFTISPSRFFMKKYTGISKRELIMSTFEELNKRWINELADIEAIKYNSLNKDKKEEYISYHSPVLVADNQVASLKTSLSRTSEIVLIDRDNSSEKVVHITGDIYPYFLSTDGSKIVWVETERDPRWEHRTYSVIKSYDIKSDKVNKLSSKSRYMSASISPDGKMIAAVENSVDNLNNLVFVDALTGEVTSSVATPENIYLQRPQWSDDGGKVTSIFLTEDGEGIVSYLYKGDSAWEYDIDANRDDYQTAFFKGDTLFFVSSVSGIENGYAKLPDGNIVQLTNSRFGAIDMVSDGRSIFFSDYSVSGNNICQIPLNSLSTIPVTNRESYIIEDIPSAVFQENYAEVQLDVEPKPYNKLANQFNLHSWFPLYVDLEEVTSDFRSIKPGVTLLSQNLLSTVISSLSYEYFKGQHVLHGDITFQGKYPVWHIRVNYALGDGKVDATSGLSLFSKLSVPLLFNNGRFSQSVDPSITLNYYSNYMLDNKLVNDNLTQMVFRFYFYNYSRLASRDIYPKFGQYIDLFYSTYLFDKESFNRMFTLRSAFYFPGGFPSSGIRLRYETDYQNGGKFISSNRSRLPRGYIPGNFSTLHYSSIDYAIPLAYPDWSLGSLLYIKRLRTNLFFDFAIANKNKYLNSKGVEIFADINFIRIPYDISSGVRLSFLKETKIPSFEVLFSMNIFGNQIGKQTML